MNHVMLDIETLDTRVSAVILSIGAVRFDPAKVGEVNDTFYTNVDIDSCLELGRTISGGTLYWWLDKEQAARDRIATNPVPLPQALEQLSQFIREHDCVWGNGAAFDNAILADAYRSCGMQTPWRYYQDMCYRTMKTLFGQLELPEFEGTKHDALDDAVNQAKRLQHILAHHQLVR